MTDFDITIIGGGPTGLFSAILAGEQGLSVCILEKRDGPLPLGRADALNARTQQIFDVAGVLKYLRPKGLQCNTSFIFKDGAFVSHNEKWWVNLKNTHYKEFLMIGQSEVEKAMLKRLNIDIHYDTAASSIQETTTHVEVQVRDKIITSKYLTAADGSHSMCRRALGSSKQILQTYDQERRTTAIGVVEVAGKLVRSTLRTAEEYVALAGKNTANITGIGITYSPSPSAVGLSSVGEFVTGARAPDFSFLKSKIVEVRFYELVQYGKSVVFKPVDLSLDLPASLAALVDVWEVSKQDEQFRVVSPAGAALTTSFDMGHGLDVVIVVRPDLYTGYVGTNAQAYLHGFVLDAEVD